MAFIRKMETGSPILYTVYDKQYDFNELLKIADEGLGEYLSNLKRGQKDYDKFILAYSDLMQGIKDGTVTFKSRMFHDSLGRYDNVSKKRRIKNRNKDYYGLMANYIFKLLNNASEYIDPKEASKIKWDDNSINMALTRSLYNSDKEDINNFVDIDGIDPTTNRRGTLQRAETLYKAYEDVLNNFDNLFTGFTESLKNSAVSNIKTAMSKLLDGKIDPGDLMALSKAADKFNYRNMFSTDGVQEKTPQVAQTESQELNVTSNILSRFAAFILKKYPVFQGTLSSPKSTATNLKFGPGATLTLANALSKLSDKELIRITRSIIGGGKQYVFNDEPFILKAFNGLNYRFDKRFGLELTLKVMKDKGLLVPISENDPEVFYIRGTATKRLTGYIWDLGNRMLYEKSFHEIPYIRQLIRNEFLATEKTLPSLYPEYTQFSKKGGILKYNLGGKNWYKDLSDYDHNKYTYSYDTSRLVNGDMRDDNFDPYISNIASKNDPGRYVPTNGFTKLQVIDIENPELNPQYSNFGKVIFDLDGKFTPEGYKWALASDALLPEDSPARIFQKDGTPNTEWVVKNKDIYGNTPRIFKGPNALVDYVNYVRNDHILGGRHNIFLNRGKRYFYKDEDGNEHWVDPSVISKYKVSEKAVRSGWNENKSVYWDDYELTGLLDSDEPKSPMEEAPKDKGKGSIVVSTDGDKRTEESPTLKGSSDIVPDVLSSWRLYLSLNANNKNYKNLKDSLNPVVENTYERFSPVTGLFQEMQMANRLGALAITRASQPFTSDATTYLLGLHEAKKLSDNLTYKGYLADDAEIKRTGNEALLRLEDNMMRRSNLANKNSASFNSFIRELGQLKATLEKWDWQSWDNYFKGIEERRRAKNEANIERENSFNLLTSTEAATREYNRIVNPIIDKFRDYTITTGRNYTTMPNYSAYKLIMDRAEQYRKAKINSNYASIYGYNYKNPYGNKSIEEVIKG